ncbi:hypothetical protein LEN26_014431 [Aphanomyces euteiches]|nr:hypothetical protein LEN26_014431 [Aphanomyces euteiches]KAH9124995.1 hypothetical protein AeMF1_004331 [Aphanomyces euteiches]KAH9189072.1 hypothetical protein AeNC1_008956 [Aphanomyces euteiches]
MERFSYSRNGGGGTPDLKCSVRVSVPQVLEVHNKTHYKIAMKTVHMKPPKAWEVLHPYSEFLALRDALISTFKSAKGKMCPGCKHYERAVVQFDFPRKHLFSSKSAEVIRYRQLSLQAFVAMLASHTFTTAPRCPTCSGRVFELVRDFLTSGGEVVDRESISSSLDEETRRSEFTVNKFVEVHAPAKHVAVDSNGVFVDSAAAKNKQEQETPRRASSTKRGSELSFGSDATAESTPTKLHKGIGSVSDLADIHLDEDKGDDDELNLEFMTKIPQ